MGKHGTSSPKIHFGEINGLLVMIKKGKLHSKEVLHMKKGNFQNFPIFLLTI